MGEINNDLRSLEEIYGSKNFLNKKHDRNTANKTVHIMEQMNDRFADTPLCPAPPTFFSSCCLSSATVSPTASPVVVSGWSPSEKETKLEQIVGCYFCSTRSSICVIIPIPVAPTRSCGIHVFLLLIFLTFIHLCG
ncbi:hypothetical protein MAR_006987, partial [Mya arenaria]